jgi:hypothetical protein
MATRATRCDDSADEDHAMSSGHLTLPACILGLWAGALACPGPALGVPRSEPARASDPGEPEFTVPCLGAPRPPAPPGQPATAGDCAEGAHAAGGFDARLGPRVGTAGGVLGTLDGLHLDYRTGRGTVVNGLVGYPGLLADDGPAPGGPTLGLSLETGEPAAGWGAGAYLIHQPDAAGTGSQVLGSAVGVLGQGRALVAADYDPAARSWAALTLAGAWKPFPGTALSASYDLHRGPVQQRRGAYLKRVAGATAGWRRRLPADRIDHFATRPAARVTTLGLGLSQTLSEGVTLTSDLLRLEVSGVGGTAACAAEHFYHLDLTGKELLGAGDTHRLGLRARATRAERAVSVTLAGDYPVRPAWRVRPRLRAGYRRGPAEAAAHWRAAPAVGVEYRWDPRRALRVEAGGEWNLDPVAAADDAASSYFLKLAYRAAF